jgi:phosphoserine phosphatase RsbU/P
MEPASGSARGPEPASLLVIDPSGHRTRVPVTPLPFSIGRQPENQLLIRDSRVSRIHARILAHDGVYLLEDAGSRHGTFLNGKRIQKEPLHNSDKIEFGVEESYQLIFALDGAELKQLLDHVTPSEKAQPGQAIGGNLGKLRAILELARTLQSSFSLDEVLSSVVDTALAITGAERGFLLLREDGSLQIRVARNHAGQRLQESDLRVPREVIRRALSHRRDLLSMNFDPSGADGNHPQSSIADLELRSVICVPLVRIQTAPAETTSLLSTANETVGVLYMDSRAGAADLAGGNRELLQALAIEASTVLENARLLVEERAKQQMEEELQVARSIQQSLLPKALPALEWLCASGSSVASHQVGGDYFDVTEVHHQCWSAVVADVSGKGVSSALLASLLQGALITATDQPIALKRRIAQLNRFLLDRTGGEKYATVFYCLITATGDLHYVNAAHCPPLVVRAAGPPLSLEATAMPVGLVPEAGFELAGTRLQPGDKVVIYTDGVTESQNLQGEFFGKKRLRELVSAHAAHPCAAIHDAIRQAVAAFTEGAPQADDITLLVLEYRGAAAVETPHDSA